MDWYWFKKYVLSNAAMIDDPTTAPAPAPVLSSDPLFFDQTSPADASTDGAAGAADMRYVYGWCCKFCNDTASS